MSSTITATEFKEALNRYSDVLKKYSKPGKDGSLSLEELDNFRFIDAPGKFSKNTGRVLELADLQKLVEWKLKHGTFRPTLAKQVASNTDEQVATATKEAFAHYAKNENDISTVLKLLAEPLKGVGPATATLLLSVHDPERIVFFSDELYSWLVADGRKISLKYSIKEFEELFKEAETFIARVNCSAQDLEKVAFVLVKENGPEGASAEKKVPNGRPRSHPAKTESEKKVNLEKKVKVPSERGPGRPKGSGKTSTASDSEAKEVDITAGEAPAKRGRPAKVKAKVEDVSGEAAKKRGRPAKSDTELDSIPTGAPKKRGRPAKVAAELGDVSAKTPKKRGRPAKAEAEMVDMPASKKRKD